MTGTFAGETYELNLRMQRIADLAGGNFWSYASASGRNLRVEALVVTDYPIGDLLEAFIAYSLETNGAASGGPADFSCGYVSILQRRVARCGGSLAWFGEASWSGTYAYASGATLYMIGGIGGIEEDIANQQALETIIGDLP